MPRDPITPLRNLEAEVRARDNNVVMTTEAQKRLVVLQRRNMRRLAIQHDLNVLYGLLPYIVPFLVGLLIGWCL